MKTKKQRDLFLALQNFYQRPVAKVSLELFFSLGLIMFFAIFAIRPTLMTMSDLLKEIEDKKELQKALNKKVAALSTVQTIYLDVEDQLYVLDEALPNTPRVIESIKVIEKTASDLNLVITGLSLNEIPEETGADSQVSFDELNRIDVPVAVTISGDYPTIRQFVENLINYRRSFSVENIVFNTQETRGNKKLEAKLTINMPYFGDEQHLETASSSK